MKDHQASLLGLCSRTAVVHTITYFFMGVLVATFLNNKEAFARPEMACWMRQLNDPMVIVFVLLMALPALGLLARK